MATVVGLKISTGEYQGHSYNNVMVHCTYGAKDIDGVGTTVHKVKRDIFANCPCAVGDEIEVLYNRFGGVEQIRVL